MFMPLIICTFRTHEGKRCEVVKYLCGPSYVMLSVIRRGQTTRRRMNVRHFRKLARTHFDSLYYRSTFNRSTQKTLPPTHLLPPTDCETAEIHKADAAKYIREIF